ncbi:hypothetical protein [Streptomyces sp. NPDC006691]|uniref:hypothetical protein n=1 Tax=Streptomyces sp. NPDC006691 TaxID=3364757 RepID=UPI00369739D8
MFGELDVRPMHGDTVTAPDGRTTLVVEDIGREIEGFQQPVASQERSLRAPSKGTPDGVPPCVGMPGRVHRARPLPDLVIYG